MTNRETGPFLLKTGQSLVRRLFFFKRLFPFLAGNHKGYPYKNLLAWKQGGHKGRPYNWAYQ